MQQQCAALAAPLAPTIASPIRWVAATGAWGAGVHVRCSALTAPPLLACRRAALLGSCPRLAGLPVANKSTGEPGDAVCRHRRPPPPPPHEVLPPVCCSNPASPLLPPLSHHPAARHAARRPHRSAGTARATAAPPAPLTGGTVAWERTLPLGPGASVTVQVATGGDEQRILVFTNRPGRLLLHWGVEGGRNYKGGWRLPGDRCRPDGTVNYKNRALQTPFRPAGSNGVGLQVRMGGRGWVWRCARLATVPGEAAPCAVVGHASWSCWWVLHDSVAIRGAATASRLLMFSTSSRLLLVCPGPHSLPLPA